MAVYTPKELRIPTNITASYATVYTATATTGIMRTYRFQTLTAHAVSLSREAGGATTTIEDGTLLTINIPYIQNGWYVIPSAGILQVKADSIATNAPTFGAWGYEYV
jgi:hypothetical protein